MSNIHCIPSLKLFWTDVRDGPEKPGWNPAFTEVERNIIIANYGGSQGFDNDDGSSWYDIHHNVIYGEGLKQDCKLFVRINVLHPLFVPHYIIAHVFIPTTSRIAPPPTHIATPCTDGGHDSKYHDNLNIVHRYDGQNCINTWPFKSGQGPCGDWGNGTAQCSHAHRFENNRCIVLYTDEYSPGAGGCPPGLDTMAHLENNT